MKNAPEVSASIEAVLNKKGQPHKGRDDLQCLKTQDIFIITGNNTGCPFTYMPNNLRPTMEAMKNFYFKVFKK